MASSSSFKRFDIASDVSDHFFRQNTSNLDKRARKKILQEWRVLEDGLPDSILVRVFETRMDLLRAAIVGAAGTPYHDGLYFFDLQFPSDYPDSPPAVKFRSHGVRINPNLYASGKVCLSLLDTWVGRRREMWDPLASTVLQVLVSIQALVLNEKPYFNEPGAAGLLGRALKEGSSMAYNERVFLLAVKMAVHSLRAKPANFEAFVVEHFRERAGAILAACGAYASGRVNVGYYGAADEAARRRRRRRRRRKAGEAELSEKFGETMQVLYRELVVAFRKNGIGVSADVEDFAEVVRRETAAFRGSEDGERGKEGGIVKRVFDKLRNVLGLKKKKKKKMNEN